MKIKIDGKDYKIPSSLMDVTLSQRIEFEKQHGKALNEKLKKISEMKDGPLKEIDFTGYHCELACRTLSFFGAIPLNVVENSEINHVLAIYHTTMKRFSEEVDFKDPEHILQQQFDWEGDRWCIAPPELQHDSAMTTAEFLDAKQWLKNFYELSQEKWKALIGVCCVYFRKVGEKYSKELSAEDGKRYKLMEKLPMPYALNVGFFLSASVDLYMKTFHSSGQMEAGSPASS